MKQLLQEYLVTYFGSYSKTFSQRMLLAMRHGLLVGFGACHLQGGGGGQFFFFFALIATRELHIPSILI